MMRFAAALAAATLIFAVPAQAQAPVKVGTLDCDISGGMGMIIASKKWVRCAFIPAARGRGEVYEGSISKFGLDFGATSGGRLVWSVYAPTSLRRWALAGSYGGATAEATFGAGLGANVLIGGNNRTVSLQPLSFQGQSGLNVAGGVANLELRPMRMSRRR
ncbi:MAG: DUF992 domain-containing protein [Pseudorhodoplanes sp.]